LTILIKNIELRAKLRKSLKSYYDTKEENVKLAKNQLAEPQRMVIDRAAKLVNLAEKSSLQHFPYAEYHSLRAALACIAPGGL
jgi:ABC-type Na+ transport system ATPase subunit NatA